MIVSVTVAPVSINGGNGATGTVTLDQPAPIGGLTVQLTSLDTGAQVPATVLVPAGATTATFAITSTEVTANTPVTINAGLNGTTVSATLNLLPPAPLPKVVSLTVTPGGAAGGSSLTGLVSLDQPAAMTGVVVTLSSSDPAVQVPTSVTVQPGDKGETFTINTSPVTTNTLVTVTASLGTSTTSIPFVVLAPGAVRGDVNGDGVVNIRDATITLKMAIGAITATAIQQALADLNGDGVVNIADATLDLRLAVGLD